MIIIIQLFISHISVDLLWMEIFFMRIIATRDIWIDWQLLFNVLMRISVYLLFITEF